ncbi:hypothetical protein TNCV_1386341 [Trichonephila clavipes]|nr:hypothetical protein TNCV_1386341 [Trichonephila clavipes]
MAREAILHPISEIHMLNDFFGCIEKAPTKNYAAKALSVIFPKAKKKSSSFLARFNETFPQAKLQAEREAVHRAAETPEQSQAWRDIRLGIPRPALRGLLTRF